MRSQSVVDPLDCSLLTAGVLTDVDGDVLGYKADEGFGSGRGRLPADEGVVIGEEGDEVDDYVEGGEAGGGVD